MHLAYRATELKLLVWSHQSILFIIKFSVIRCPAGWIPMGPWCTATALVIPFTECPNQRKRYHSGHVLKPVFTSPTPGICMSNEGTGVLLRCPPGLTLETTPTVSDIYPRKAYVLDQDKKKTQHYIMHIRRAANMSATNAAPPRQLWQGDPRLPETEIIDFDDDAFITPSEYRCVGVDQRIYSPQQVKQILRSPFTYRTVAQPKFEVPRWIHKKATRVA
eukprot:Gregarina_sp_Poly_1__2334@NODE_1623_length_3686_cov_43_129317_g1070_i0_p2_GENE_NODE_1623_length_3686_cov_43_129317_g1070_i0NODE_1623_length_3686_cov_43_129317_g1070_i0_p2_ORF_typecomplete_len219_score7_78_NODE_1623_length_3686_cov_43_129317_g1070_i029183574